MDAETAKAIQIKIDGLYTEQNTAFEALRRAISLALAVVSQHRILPILNNRLDHLEQCWSTCVAYNRDICSFAAQMDQSNEIYFTERKFQLAEVEYINAKDQLAIWQHALIQTSHVPPVSPVEVNVKLPRLSIPPFSGKLTEWVPFRDSFIALVKSNTSLTDVAKLHYLKASMQGEANEIVCNVQLSQGNFGTAWSLLEARYENKRIATNAHFSEIFKIEQIKKESASSILNLRNIVKRNIAALKNLGCPTEHYGAILIYVLTEKLDQQTQRDWEIRIAANTDIPDYDEFDKFLLERIRVLETLSQVESVKRLSQTFSRQGVTQPQMRSYDKQSKQLNVNSYVVTQSDFVCPICHHDHKIYSCTKFKELSVAERFDYVRSCNLCINCLGKGHKYKDCPSPGTCRQCNQQHHTMLHRDSSSINQVDSKNQNPTTNSVQSHLSIQRPIQPVQVLLATAKVWLYSSQGRKLQVRALLDQGSTWSFVSSKVAGALGVPRIKVAACITGLSGSFAGTTSNAINIQLFNQTDQLVCQTQALVLPKITSYVAKSFVSIAQWPHLNNLQLADDLSSDDEINMLIGADIYGSILRNQLRKGQAHEPIAQETSFGWVIFGPCSESNQSSSASTTVHHTMIESRVDCLIQKFWEVESIPQKATISPDDELCESYFSETHSRYCNGRYIVRIPFKSNEVPVIGKSRSIAENLLKRVETRLDRNLEHKTLYSEFMREYETLNHMAPVGQQSLNQTPIVYLPHHPIIREQSQTTKLRVVFNASCKTSNGHSINDYMVTGPKLQSELFVILSQWRSYPLVFVADIAQMYRQILVDPRDRNYQRILWRPLARGPPMDYQLNTVTYGTRSAPYLALRVIKQLVMDHGDHFPLATPVLNHDTFVDDLLFGVYDDETALAVRNEVIQLLGKAQLEPRKWASNNQQLLSDIDPINHGLALTNLSPDACGVTFLGIKWNPSDDIFTYKVNLELPSILSKRKALSLLSQLFDPLGWVSPVIIKGKILMQKLWLHETQWDEPLNSSLTNQWKNYFESLKILSQIQIPRWNKHHPDNQSSELHGFADASTEAYGAVIYLRTVDKSGQIDISLIISKTKVAPLKQISVHRLELQAALLLAQLAVAVHEVRAFSDIPIQCWTDSSITLAWLKKHASTWKLFVANRVAEIHELLPEHQWKHVPTLTNPADLASRGSTPSDLVINSLWWCGPEWLGKPPTEWPNTIPDPPLEATREAKITVLHVVKNLNTPLQVISHKFSLWTKAVRITAYLLRYKTILKFKVKQRKSEVIIPCPVSYGYLSSQELNNAKIVLYLFLQSQMFPTELKTLKNGQPVSTHSKLVSLNPFVEHETGLLRVGGRLTHSSLSYEAQHPVILQSHPLVSALIRYVHLRCLHGGMKITLSTLRQTVWLINPRPQVKSILYKCIICTRIRAQLASQLMANLPKSRVTRSQRAFTHCGVDYAGPLNVRMAGGRGIRSQQCYIALFICLSIKAVHLELVSDYSSPTFIAAFRRFISRRGAPVSMHSDRGTTFQGADRLLHEKYIQAVSSPEFQACLSQDNIQWQFIPPAAPHFGGIWEAGVKSVKTHLIRVLLNQTPAYEELTTLLCQIEAVLNSRPLEPLTDLIDDLDPLTPSHFITGGPLTILSERSLLDLNPNRLNRWAQMQQNLELFWKRWSTDYSHDSNRIRFEYYCYPIY